MIDPTTDADQRAHGERTDLLMAAVAMMASRYASACAKRTADGFDGGVQQWNRNTACCDRRWAALRRLQDALAVHLGRHPIYWGFRMVDMSLRDHDRRTKAGAR
ncbi:hypothetical protein [Catellatospora sp. NPDC049609]|uniref:hypothetical protein n=1 Tax=Catellatospora sp. NPDC049609 TaxID=3155505 RepID=UPI00342178D0